MTTYYRWMLAAGMALSGLGASHAAEETATTDSMEAGFLQQTIDIHGKEERFVVYVPDGYTPDRTWPLIVFLHGAGERGNDGVVHSKVGIGPAIEKNPERFPAIVLMPQCPTDSDWHARHDQLEAQLAWARDAYTIDPKRIYLTGLSMGGYGTWLWGAIHTDTFAALMPICGGGDPEDILKRLGIPGSNPYGSHASRVRALATVPIWAFHGSADTSVPPEMSRAMVEAIKARGGDIQYTEYKGVGHNSWDRAYGDAEAIAWLLAQKKE